MAALNSPITSHVLDTARGRPAEGVPVAIDIARDGAWVRLAESVTNDDGRVPGFVAGHALERARYRVTFDTAAYFAKHGQTGFYPYVEVVFEITAPDQHHHIPLLLSPYGYSTYRGS
ncbi:MAG: hydroxyisourate hydrolase [Deltaproteobacteria bacterium]|nr:hydroxyisourate hydrolase [Deltaproteobacteria bacterium]